MNFFKPWDLDSSVFQADKCQQTYMMSITTFVGYRERCTAFMGFSLAPKLECLDLQQKAS